MTGWDCAAVWEFTRADRKIGNATSRLLRPARRAVLLTRTVIEDVDILEARALRDWVDETHAGHRQIVQTD